MESYQSRRGRPEPVSADDRQRVEGVIRDRLGEKVINIEMETGVNEFGDEVIFIRVQMSRDTTAKDFSGRFFGLTGRVRDVMSERMQGFFPIIRPVEAVETHA